MMPISDPHDRFFLSTPNSHERDLLSQTTSVTFCLHQWIKKPFPNAVFFWNGFVIHQRKEFGTVKILNFGTPQTIAIIILKIEKFDVTLH